MAVSQWLPHPAWWFLDSIRTDAVMGMDLSVFITTNPRVQCSAFLRAVMAVCDELFPKAATNGDTLSIGVVKRNTDAFFPFDESAYLEHLKPNDDEIMVLEMKDRNGERSAAITLYYVETEFHQGLDSAISYPGKWTTEQIKMIADTQYYWIVTRRGGYNMHLWIAATIVIAELFGGLVDTFEGSLDHLNWPMNAAQLRAQAHQLYPSYMQE